MIKNFKIFNVFNKRNRKWGIKFQNEFLDIKGMDRSQNFMLKEIDVRVAANLEEEICDPYDTTIVRMYVYGIDPIKFFLST